MSGPPGGASTLDATGPTVMATLVEGIEYGVLLNQYFHYFTRSSRDNWLVRVMALWVFGVATFQTGAVYSNMWVSLVQNYGTPGMNAIGFRWPAEVTNAVGQQMASTLHAYLIYRVYVAYNRKWWIPVILGALMITAYVASIWMTVVVFKTDFNKLPLPTPGHPFFDPTIPTFMVWVISNALLDLSITGLLLFYLLKSKAKVSSKKASKVIARLVSLIWETAVPPAMVAVVVMIMKIVGSFVNPNLWELFFQFPLGKLYALALIFNLNIRLDIRDAMTSARFNLSSIPRSTQLDGIYPLQMNDPLQIEVRTTKYTEEINDPYAY